MVKLIYDILPPKVKPFWKRNSGRITIGALALFVVASLLATGYFYFFTPSEVYPEPVERVEGLPPLNLELVARPFGPPSRP